MSWQYITIWFMHETIAKTILLVEDEIILAMTEKMSLEKYGYTVITAQSGEKAVEIVKNTAGIDLVLMDIDLGSGMDGTQTAAQILSTRDIPVVFLSSHTEPSIVEKTEKITSYGYVVKNSSITVLDASIKMAFKLFDAYQNLKRKSEKDHEHTQLLENIMDNFPGIIFWKDINLNYQGGSMALAAAAGLRSPKDIIGKSDYDLPWSESETENYRKADRSVIETGVARVHILETQNTVNGKTVSLDTTKMPLRDLHNHIVGVLGVSIDISDRIQKEKELRKSEEKFSKIFRESPCPVMIVDTDNGNFVDVAERKKNESALAESTLKMKSIIEGTRQGTWEWNVQTGETTLNDTWAELIGYTLDELTPITINTWEAFAHPDDLKQSGELLRKHFSGESPYYESKSRMKHKDGHWVWILDRGKVLTRTADGKPLLMFGTHTDITEAKQKETTLKESLERFRAFFYENNAMMLLIDPDTGDIKSANKAALDFYGYTAEQFYKMNIRQINTLTADEIKQHMTLALQEKKKYFVFNHRLSNGEVKIVEVNSTPIRIAEKTSLLSIIHDVTEQKSAEKKIGTLVAEKDLVLKEVHHRIKNNMNTIYGLLVLQAGTLTEPAAIAALEDAGNRVKTMQLLYNKLFLSVDFNQMPLAEYLRPLIDELIPIFPLGFQVRTEKSFDEIILHVQKLQPLGIIVNELLTNIMKYAFIGKSEGTIGVSATLKENRITVTITDNGNGMPASVDFDNSTGFGLILVKGLTRQLDGTIRIERGNGTKVVLEFER